MVCRVFRSYAYARTNTLNSQMQLPVLIEIYARTNTLNSEMQLPELTEL